MKFFYPPSLWRPPCMYLLGLMFVLLIPEPLRAQIVPNGSFEQRNGYSFKYWVNPTTSSPDYFHRTHSFTNLKIPRNFAGYQQPKGAGDSAYAGIYTGDLPSYGQQNEYVQVPLNVSLRGGKSYQVKFYVSYAAGSVGGGLPGYGNNGAYLKKMGAHFSSVGIRRSDDGPFTEQPQVESDTWLKDTVNWMLIKGVIDIPDDSTYSFMTIGCFGNNPDYLPTGFGSNNATYYYIDSVSIDSCFADAGPDVTICKGTFIDLPIPSNKNMAWTYKAVSGDLNSILNGNRVCPDVSTRYVLTVVDPEDCCTKRDTVTVFVKNCCACADTCFKPQNLTRNGDFEEGPPGKSKWTSDYNLNETLSPGHGGVVKDVSNITYGGGHTEGIDHTFGDSSGWFLFIDGHCDPANCSSSNPIIPAPNKAWCQKVKVKPNTYYDFSAWIMNIQKTGPFNNELPVIQLKVGNEYLCSPVTYNKQNWPNKWQKQSCKWYSGSNNDSVEICIMMMVNGYSGMDFAIDDICFISCKPSAGPDHNICKGDSVTLPLPDSIYTWSYRVLSGDMGSLNANTAKPQVTSTYLLTVIDPNNKNCSVIDTVVVYVKKCCTCPDTCSVPGPDLIKNGGFDKDTADFTSDYNPNPGIGTLPGDYWVVTNVNGWNSNTWTESGNPNKFLYVDGSKVKGNNLAAWRQTVTGLTIGRKYVFCMDVNNLMLNSINYDDPIPQVRINGVPIGSVSIPELPDAWTNVSYTWVANSTTATITIVDINDTTHSGNDFGIDNISFRACIPKTPANAGPDTTICKGYSYALPIPSPAYQWSYRNISNIPPIIIPGNIVAPTKTTVYELTVIDPVTGCINRDTVVVKVKCCYCYPNTGNAGTSLIINGDFSAGNTGFTTMYSVGGPIATGPGYYWVQPFSSVINSNWDKTGDPGNFLFADGSTSASTYVWQQTVPVIPGKDYSLCAYAINLNKSPGYPSINDPQVSVYINGSPVATAVINETDAWTPLTATWNAGMSSFASIEVYSLNTSSAGNDFGIDNIGFSPCDPPSAPGRPESSSGSGSGTGSTQPGEGIHPRLNIYPNPASNSIHVLLPLESTDAEKLMIIDMSGRTVKSIPLNAGHGKDLDVSLTGLSKGIYTIAVYNSNGCMDKKLFMKE